MISGTTYGLHPVTIRNLTDSEVLHIASQSDDPIISRLFAIADFAASELADRIASIQRFHYGVGSDGFLELTYADDGVLVEYQDVIDCLK